MTAPSRLPRLTGRSRPLAALAIGALGAAILSGITSQGYLHATVVTGAGYTGSVAPAGPVQQVLALLAWVSVGGIAGWIARSGAGLVALWAGALLGSFVGFASDPAGNILWLDLLVTVFGVAFFLTPGFFLGAALSSRRDRLEPDGSGRRPTPPPLWAMGTRQSPAALRDPVAAPPDTTARSYARPGSRAPDQS